MSNEGSSAGAWIQPAGARLELAVFIPRPGGCARRLLSIPGGARAAVLHSLNL